MENQHKKSPPYFGGVLVLIVLAIFTGGEYILSTSADNPPLAPLAVIALVKAAIIVNYYMHISRMWSTEEDSH
jgi:hypothetical protein